MKGIIAYIGMDVHKKSYTLCTYLKKEDKVLYKTKINANIYEMLEYIKAITEELEIGKENIECGYEAGCLGYSVKKALEDHGIKCIIMAPTTILNINNKRVKTDRRDAENIARNLGLGVYKEVRVLDEIDEEVKEYIRMRDDHKIALTKIKQQINGLVLRHGKIYDGTKSKWTQAHIEWLKKLELRGKLRIILDEYLYTYNQLKEKIERYDKEIENFSQEKRYEENAKKLKCFIGINTLTAMSILSEVGDFGRFETAQQFSSFIGLVPKEHSSSESIRRSSITKAGNNHLRHLLVESAHCYSRGSITGKSKTLKKRQEGNKQEIIEYVDKANERMKRKFYRLMKNGKKYNIISTAIARELTCYIWGLMNNKIA